MIAIRDIAWLAGLIEGEGSFIFSKSPCIQMQMTDEDVIARAADLMGTVLRSPRKPKGKPHYKTTYTVRVHGSRAVAWMQTIYTFMGERRRAKIEEIIAKWLSMPGYPKASHGSRLPSLCHPDRIRVSRGMCRECYMAKYRETYVAP